MRLRVRDRLHEEHGAVSLTFALIFIPFFVGFMALVMTAGDWWVHKRHLQTQADAAALAAAQDFGFPVHGRCRRTCRPSSPTGAGRATRRSRTPSANVHFVVNKPTYYGQARRTTRPTADPCDSKMVDVKATEDGLVGPIDVGLIPNDQRARARGVLPGAERSTATLPIAVPEPAPKHVKAYFVDESTTAADRIDRPHAGTAPTPMATRSGTTAAPRCQLDDEPGQDRRPDRAERRVVDDVRRPAGRLLRRGTSSEPRLHPWLDDGQRRAANNADPRSVTLTSSTCVDPYFSRPRPCNVAVTADVDFGTGNHDPRPDGARRCASRPARRHRGQPRTTYTGAAVMDVGRVDPGRSRRPAPIDDRARVGRAARPPHGQVNGEADLHRAGSRSRTSNANPCQDTLRQRPAHVRRRRRALGPDASMVQIQQRRVAGANSLRQCDSGQHVVHVSARRQAERPRVARRSPSR